MRIHYKITWLAAALVLVATGCHNSPWEPTPKVTLTVQVQGTVTDADTGAPLYGVVIYLTVVSKTSWFSPELAGEKVYTDKQGKYLVTGWGECPFTLHYGGWGGYYGGYFIDRLKCTEDLQTLDFTMK